MNQKVIEPQMYANERELILKDEANAVVSCAFEILNGLGHGLYEKPYENALTVEFAHRGVPYVQQSRFPVVWRDIQAGEFIPDIIAFDQMMLNYLRITKLQVGLILNFKKPKLEWERIILSR